MRALRVLELRSAWGAGGGPEKTILLSAKRHDKERVRARVVYLRDPRDEGFARGIRARAAAIGQRIIEVPDRGRLDPCCVAHLRRLARRADIIHAHDYKTDLFGLLLGRGNGHAKLLATAHGWTNETRTLRVYQKLDFWALGQYDRVIAVSTATRETLLEGGVDARKIVVLNNGIDEQEWAPGASDLRSELGLSGLVVGTVSRLSHEKGIDQLIEVARLVPGATFVVAGDGPHRPELEARIASAGLTGQFRLIGQRTDALRVHATLDVFALTSRRENMPNALLEAMACGKPCVAFGVGGVPETLGEAGKLIAPEDVRGMAATIRELLENPMERARLGLEARRRIEAEFSFARRLDRIETIYEDLAGRPRRTGRRLTASVVIPARNEAARLPVALPAVLKAAKRVGAEVIVADHGSTDETARIARELEAVVVCARGARTISEVRNRGARAATGDILAFLDADCVPEEPWLEAGLAIFESEPGVGAAGWAPRVPRGSPWTARACALFAQPDAARVHGRTRARWLASANFLVRRGTFERLGGFDPELRTCEDYDLTVRIKASGEELVRDPALVVEHLRESESLSCLFRRERWRGQDSLAGALRHGLVPAEVPSLAMPAAHVGLVVALPLAGALDVRFAFVALALLLLPTLALALRAAIKARAPFELPALLVVAAVYSAARAWALVESLVPRRKRVVEARAT